MSRLRRCCFAAFGISAPAGFPAVHNRVDSSCDALAWLLATGGAELVWKRGGGVTTAERKVEYYAALPSGDVYVSVRFNPDGDAYVSADWHDEHGKFARCIVAETVCEPNNDLDAIRNAFQVVRGRLRSWARSWQEHRAWAAREKGGKRGYYTKHANESRKLAIKYGADWKLRKAIWKEITKL